MAINGVTTDNNRKWHSILPSFQRTLYSRKKLENKNFSKASRWEIAKTSILPTTCFKQFLCSSLLASTFGKSLSAVFVASLNSAWRHVESVITAISHFSLWSKTLQCWHILSKSTNQRVYQDLVYRKALLLRILTSVPSPLSPVPLYFLSLSLLRTALHYLNVWNRLPEVGWRNTKIAEKISGLCQPYQRWIYCWPEDFIPWLITLQLFAHKLIKWLPGECADWFFDNIMTWSYCLHRRYSVPQQKNSILINEHVLNREPVPLI